MNGILSPEARSMERVEGTIDRVRDGLRRVLDPELGLDVVSLGLVYSIVADGDRIEVVLTLTSPACPLGQQLRVDAETAVRAVVPDAAGVDVRLTLEPAWHPGLMSAAAKRQLGWG
jgi:metal-sulfur cluster biosynthetic enzyme